MTKRRRTQKKRKMRVVRDRKKMKERMNLDFQLRYNSQICSLVEYFISPRSGEMPFQAQSGILYLRLPSLGLILCFYVTSHDYYDNGANTTMLKM